MNRKEIDEMRGRKLTIGKHEFLFTRKPVRSAADVAERNMTMAAINAQLEQMVEAAKIAKVVKKTFQEDLDHYFLTCHNRIHTKTEQQLGLFEQGEVLEEPDDNRPKTEAREPGKKPKSRPKLASG